MSKLTILSPYFIVFLSVIICCAPPTPDSDWESIWNGKDLSGWHTYLGVPHSSVEIEGVEKNEDGRYDNAVGVDNDPLANFTVVDLDDGKAIRISGQIFGMMYTEREFNNYHLKLKVKWGEQKFAPRANQKRDSGLLYHGFGEPGSADYWMGSQELQIQEGDMGDYWPVGHVEIDIPSKPLDSLYYVYDPGSELRTYYWAPILGTATQDSLAKRRCFKNPDNEKPNGEWNDVELICFGDESIHIVNGEIVMRLYNSKRVDGENPVRLDSGKIILQSEGAELFYKDLEVRPIEEIPVEYAD